MKAARMLFCLMIAAAAGCGSSTRDDSYAARMLGATLRQSRLEYVVAPGDTLHVSVWKNPDLTMDVVVRPDGKISFPLVDQVQVAGLTIPQVDRVLTEALSEYIRRPDVSVSLVKMGQRKVVVLGEVRYPGVYKLEASGTLLEAIARAGGYTRDAVLRSVILIRRKGKRREDAEARRVNVASLLRGEADDVALLPGDVIYVPRTFISNVHYFLNHILDPLGKGAYIRDHYLRWEKNGGG